MNACPLIITVSFTKSQSLDNPSHAIAHVSGAQRSKDKTLCGLPAAQFEHTAPFPVGENRPGSNEPADPFWGGKGCPICLERLAV